MTIHEQLGIASHKLDKLHRKMVSTNAAHSDILASGTWEDYSFVEKALDSYLKASDAYHLELKSVSSR